MINNYNVYTLCNLEAENELYRQEAIERELGEKRWPNWTEEDRKLSWQYVQFSGLFTDIFNEGAITRFKDYFVPFFNDRYSDYAKDVFIRILNDQIWGPTMDEWAEALSNINEEHRRLRANGDTDTRLVQMLWNTDTHPLDTLAASLSKLPDNKQAALWDYFDSLKGQYEQRDTVSLIVDGMYEVNELRQFWKDEEERWNN